MAGPLVSVVCLCYNHEKFVAEAITSVLNQSYDKVELIVVDDSSTDHSALVIKEWVANNPNIKFIQLIKNVGNCTAFNEGLRQCTGEYIIDFAADDILCSQRIEEGVKALQSKSEEYGVQFSDALLIDEQGNDIGLHSDKFPHDTIPSGDIYLELIKRYFVCSPTMLIRRTVLEKLDGYDESLAYEDFDFLIRSSRQFKFIYLPSVLVKRRILRNSMRSKQFSRGSSQLRTTYSVCLKINDLNQTIDEKKALRQRIQYEFKVCLKLLEFSMALRYLKLFFAIV